MSRPVLPLLGLGRGRTVSGSTLIPDFWLRQGARGPIVQLAASTLNECGSSSVMRANSASASEVKRVRSRPSEDGVEAALQEAMEDPLDSVVRAQDQPGDLGGDAPLRVGEPDDPLAGAGTSGCAEEWATESFRESNGCFAIILLPHAVSRTLTVEAMRRLLCHASRTDSRRSKLRSRLKKSQIASAPPQSGGPSNPYSIQFASCLWQDFGVSEASPHSSVSPW